MLQELGLLGEKVGPTPMDPSHKLNKESDTSPLSNLTFYHNLIGKLLYITRMRSNINFSVCRLSQVLSKPTNDHLQVAFRKLRYIKTELTKWITFKTTTFTVITVFSDSEWVSF